MGKIKILLVDDEREEREGISWLIEKYKYPLEIMQASFVYVDNSFVSVVEKRIKQRYTKRKYVQGVQRMRM